MNDNKDNYLVCLGRGYTQIPFIRKTKLLGHKIICFDKNNNSIGKKIYVEKAFKNFLKKNKNKNFLEFNCYSSKNSRLLTSSVLGQKKIYPIKDIN